MANSQRGDFPASDRAVGALPRPAPASATVVRLLLLALLCSLPLRLIGIGGSLWLDEAWVANSVLAPTTGAMLYYANWLQSSPPLWLLLERLAAAVAGSSEVALRALPVAYGIAACGLAVYAFRQVTSTAGLAAGFAVMAGNYWVIKYALQVKQFSADILASMLVLALGVRVLRGPSPTGRVTAWLAAATVLPTLSLPALFWLPTLVLLAALVVDADGRLQRRVAWWPALAVAACAAVFGVLTLWFIGSHAGMSGMQSVSWREGMVSPARPWVSLWALAQNVGSLIVPPAHPIVDAVAAVSAALLAVAAVWLTVRGLRASRLDLTVAVLASVPAIVALTASALGRYPLLDYTRLVVWTLPPLALVAAKAADALVERLPQPARRPAAHGLVAVAMAVCLAMPAALAAWPRPQEGGAEAVRHLLSSARPQDCIYVHAGMWEQYHYYARGAAAPACMIWGNAGWPCCAKRTEERATEPTATTLESDLPLARQRAGQRTLWLLLPGGDSGHWSAHLRPGLDRAGELAACGGAVASQRFGQTRVLRVACAAP